MTVHRKLQKLFEKKLNMKKEFRIGKIRFDLFDPQRKFAIEIIGDSPLTYHMDDYKWIAETFNLTIYMLILPDSKHQIKSEHPNIKVVKVSKDVLDQLGIKEEKWKEQISFSTIRFLLTNITAPQNIDKLSEKTNVPINIVKECLSEIEFIQSYPIKRDVDLVKPVKDQTKDLIKWQNEASKRIKELFEWLSKESEKRKRFELAR